MFKPHIIFFFLCRDTVNLNTDKEYYNDLPGKLPPDMLHEEEMQKRSQRNVVKVKQVFHLLIVF